MWIISRDPFLMKKCWKVKFVGLWTMHGYIVHGQKVNKCGYPKKEKKKKKGWNASKAKRGRNKLNPNPTILMTQYFFFFLFFWETLFSFFLLFKRCRNFMWALNCSKLSSLKKFNKCFNLISTKHLYPEME